MSYEKIERADIRGDEAGSQTPYNADAVQDQQEI